MYTSCVRNYKENNLILMNVVKILNASASIPGIEYCPINTATPLL